MSDVVTPPPATGTAAGPARRSRPHSPPALWELYFLVVFTAVLILTLVPDTGQPLGRRLGVWGLLLAMAAWYVAFGRRIIATEQPQTWRGYVFQAGMLALFAPAYALVNSASFMLAALTPLAYMTLRLKPAHGFVAALAFTPAMTSLATGDLAALGFLLPFGAVIFSISAAVAVTIDRTERLSAERAALIEELASTRAEVARLSREAGIAEERQRVAGDIHDTVAQGLSSVVMLIQAAEAAMDSDPQAVLRHLAMAARTARENLDEARAIVGALTPTPLVEASLPEALARLTDRARIESGIAVGFAVENTPRILPTSVDVVLLRAAQEALSNVRKHSGAVEASVRLSFAENSVLLEVRDEGRGFDPSRLPIGYGLGAMRSRVEQVGGRLVVDSAVGQGTTVRTEIHA